MEFIHEKNRIAVYSDEGKTIAFVSFPEQPDGTVNVDHTVVDESLRNQGVAGKLMEELVSELEKSDKKASLSCSYAVKWFEKHPEHSDIIIKK